MRIWEIDDKAMSAGLVREQDFILQVRRMQRHASNCLVLNFVLNALPPLTKNRGAFEAVQQKLQEFAKVSQGTAHEMSNGDLFIVWEDNPNAAAVANQIVDTIFPEHSGDKAQFLLHYHMPRDYALLRERANHYVELVRSSVAVGLDGAGRVDDARGPLTAKNVDQIGQLLGEIDLRHYGRTQAIYKNLTGKPTGKWEAIGAEYFISLEDLRRERFPKLEMFSTEHFYLALCGMIDQRLLSILTTSYELIGGKRINLNLSVTSILGTVFNQFVKRVPREQRHLIGFELHRGDLFQDFALTLNAVDVLKREGFHVAIDSVTPDMIPYLDVASFNVDTFKVNVSKDRALQLNDKKIRLGLERLPAEKIIFFRCDNERAFIIGCELGVTSFQGWLIDDLVAKRS